MLADSECESLVGETTEVASESPGTRCLLSLDWCRSLVGRLRSHPGLSAMVPADHVGVQCTYFEKSSSRNWLVPIHQDLSIPVAERVDSAELRVWSEKEGMLFVQPPVDVLESLVAVRLHLDRSAAEDGPLQVVPGTHRQGRIEPQQARHLRGRGPLVACTLERGDALVMRPLLLHASPKASGTSRRRVLHVLFGPRQLPYGLEWRHAV